MIRFLAAAGDSSSSSDSSSSAGDSGNAASEAPAPTDQGPQGELPAAKLKKKNTLDLARACWGRRSRLKRPAKLPLHWLGLRAAAMHGAQLWCTSQHPPAHAAFISRITQRPCPPPSCVAPLQPSPRAPSPPGSLSASRCAPAASTWPSPPAATRCATQPLCRDAHKAELPAGLWAAGCSYCAVPAAALPAAALPAAAST